MTNRLLDRLAAKPRGDLLARCETVHLTLSQVICEAGDLVRHVYFPVEGFISLVAVVGDSPGIEVGMVGAEGMFGTSLVLGIATHPVRAVAQGGGWAWRVRASGFKAELLRSAALRRLAARYLFVNLSQQHNSAVCLRFHPIASRLARWLLMSQDRAHAARFHVTQEFLGYLLGVRRVGVTQAASALQAQGLIAYRRGEMEILDRGGMEAAACGCYAADRAIYAEVLG